MLKAFYVCGFVSFAYGIVVTQDLGGKSWKAIGNQPPSNLIISLSNTSVPGCVHLDWMRGKNITQDFYYRFNDDKLGWIAKSNWKYFRSFEATGEITNTYERWLVLEGVDTIATITLNGKILGMTSNMFKTYRFNISSILQRSFNLLEVSFQSAIDYAAKSFSSQPYDIPPNCPPDVQHGFCHVNMIRKEQCSFSWDWGPAFATQGIWKPVYLLSLNYAVITRATAGFDWAKMLLEVDVQFLLVMFADQSPLYGNVTISIDELKVIQHFANVELPRTGSELTSKTFSLNFKKINFEKWWPNGYGAQKLYNVSVTFQASRGYDVSSKNFLFGFRKVELIQEKIAGSDGLSFYFRINDLPIFAKGANWIPADAFKTRITHKTYERLLQSAADAHMNMLRVWGGGVYEDQHFYETADRLGIMLWQDFMFACALYPSDSNFLSNVTQEISEAIWQLKHHPSVVIWAGNNENEAALSTDWYNTTAHFDRYKNDYIKLYIDTIGKEVKNMDSTRPFVSSSPSNGVETVSEGGLAKNPYDSHYGDVHYYNYNSDCLDSSKYPPTRFASEYGFQSWPSFETVQPITIKDDWSYDSAWANHVQHHGSGNQEMLDQITKHFNIPTVTNKTENFTNIIYLTQIMQGLCYKSETEFYRRIRNETVNGAGHTMGALYWQLNDIWQAPTWSSLEYGGKWKALHYFASQFFAPVSLIVYEDDSVLTVYSASDVSRSITGTLVVSVRTWDGFSTTGTVNHSVIIPAHTSTVIYQESTGTILHYGGCPYKEICYITVEIKEEPSIPMNTFFPVRFKNIEHLHQPNFKIKTVSKVKSNEYDITVTSDKPALFVWLEAWGVKGRFSENAFVMSESSKVIKFYSWQENVSSENLQNSLNVRSINDLFIISEDPTMPPRVINSTSTVTWLDDDTIKMTFAVIGLLLIIMTSSQVICLVLRLNNPTRRPKTGHLSQQTGKPPRRLSSTSSNSSWASGMSNLHHPGDNEATGFLIQTKKGDGKNEKKTEFRFYII